MVINGKKIFAIFISLIFVASVFGIASTMASVGYPDKVTATPEIVKVGDLITVTTNFDSCQDSDIIADGNKPKGDAELVSRPDTSFSKGLEPVDETYTWVYRATAPGTINLILALQLQQK